MRIYENIETLVVVSELKGVICNKCGEVFSSHDDKIQPFNTPLGDYGDCKYEICDACSLEFIRSFKIVPDNFGSDPNFTSSFDIDHELHQRLFEEWKSSNVWNCNENPYRDHYSEDNSYQEFESYDEYYEEISDAVEVRKPLHINVVKLATIHKIGLVKRWCEDND